MPKLITTDAQDEKALAAALGWVETNVLKLIATRGLPLLLGWGVFNGVLAWLQDVIGLNLPKEAVAGYLITMLSGGVVALGAWVLNHGRGASRVLAALIGDAQTAINAFGEVRNLSTGTLASTSDSSSTDAPTVPPLDAEDNPAIGSTAGTPPVAGAGE